MNVRSGWAAPAVIAFLVLSVFPENSDDHVADASAGGAVSTAYEEDRRTVDPERDGWDSEVLSDAADGQIKSLVALMRKPDQLTSSNLRPLAVDDFACGSLRPNDLKVVWQDENLAVRRGNKFGGAGDSRGPARLALALRELLGPVSDGRLVRLKVKQFRIHVSGKTFATQAYYHAAGLVKGRIVEQNATLSLQWITGSAGNPPLLTSASASDFEETITRRGVGPWLADCTVSAIGHNTCFAQQLMYGQEHWLRRRQKTLGIDNQGHHGLAVGDVNGDGLEDLYVCQTGGLPNRLFVQSTDGTATDVAKEAGVDFMERTNSALLIDIDNDGDQDLVLGSEARLMLLANDSRGNFTIRSLDNFPNAFSLASADYDNDGDLDIFACFYAFLPDYRRAAGLRLQPMPYHDANNGHPNTLLRNDGNWKLTDVTSEVGMDKNNNRWSFAASWEDYDNDGDLDLYVANDYGRNNLWRNDGGKFVDVAPAAGVEDIASGMSVSWGDYNRDGHMDLYVGNMFSAAGGRITYQRRFHEDSGDEVRGHLQRLARGNTLFLNRGDGRFLDVSEKAAVTMGRWAWGSNWVDLNNDGWLDLVVGNGFLTNEKPDDL